MLDRPSAGADRGLDPFGAVGMGDAIGAMRLGLVARGLHFLGAKLERARYAADRQDRSGRDQLDEIGAVIEEVAGAVAGFGRVADLTHPERFGNRYIRPRAR